MKKYILLVFLYPIYISSTNNHFADRLAFISGSLCGNVIQEKAINFLLKQLLFGKSITSPASTEERQSENHESSHEKNSLEAYDKISVTLLIHYFWGFIQPILECENLMRVHNISPEDNSFTIWVKGLSHGLQRNPISPFVDFMNRLNQKNKRFFSTKTTDSFDAVIGAEEAKKQLANLITFLKNPDALGRLGGKINHGILLIGAPGNGKTLLARALAGEAKCSFFNVSGAEFAETYIGTGAARVRELFTQARLEAPSIIFIDEIESIGKKRGTSFNSQEIENTLNELLVQIDGFKQNDKPIIIIAATNFPEILDPALLRGGRFDRQIEVPLPDITTREKILTFYAQKIKIASHVDIKEIAYNTTGFSAADLANLINQAALIATHENLEEVTTTQLEEARDLITFGAINTSTIMSAEEKKITAFHEAGHALMYLLLEDMSFRLHKVTIVPRGRALGVTSSHLEQEKYSYSKEELFAHIQASLGGRIAEEIQFGIISTGASNDFEKASNIARDMVCKYGMTHNLGTINYSQFNGDFTYSQKTAEMIDAEVRSIINNAYKETHTLLTKNKYLLDKLAHALLDQETLGVEEIYKLLELTPRN